MANRIRIGIIGCGQIAQHHLKTYQAIPEAEVVALCDIDPVPLKRSSETFKIERCYKSLWDMIKCDDIDAVDVCLHNNLHVGATVAGLEAGKHVYCEKPMAGTYRDAVTMLETAQRVGKRLHIQLSMLYTSETRAAKQLIESGELGEIYHARSTGFRRRGRLYVDGYGSINFVSTKIAAGGALFDMGVYHISQVLYLLGNPEVKRVSGKTYQKIDMDAKRRAASGYDVEELGMGFVRFAGDLTMDVVEAWAVNLDSFEGSSVLGSKGGVRLQPFGYYRNFGDVEVNGDASMDRVRYRWNNVHGDGPLYENSQAHWIAALQGKVEQLPTPELALNTMLISEGIYLSNTLGREVSAEEVKAASVSRRLEV